MQPHRLYVRPGLGCTLYSDTNWALQLQVVVVYIVSFDKNFLFFADVIRRMVKRITSAFFFGVILMLKMP